MIKEDQEHFCYSYARPAVTADVVVFAVLEGDLSVLLVRRRNEPWANCWALPGGFVDTEETLGEAARRELQEETGLRDIFIEQLYTFGDPGRDPRGRTITVAYYAMLEPAGIDDVCPGDDAAGARWFEVETLEELAFDHAEIVRRAVDRLQGKVQYTTAAFRLLSEEFTFSQLQQVYEAINRKRLDRRNFRKWINGLRLLEETGEHLRGGYRPAQLYRLRSGLAAGDLIK